MSLARNFANPESQVIAMAGDGGLAMLMGDLLTDHTENAVRRQRR